MTYIKSERSNRSFQVEQLLAEALTAARQQNWLAVSDRLKQLPQNQAKSFLLTPAHWDVAFDLALKILLEADFQHKWEIAKLLPSFGAKVVTPLCTLVSNEAVEVEARWFICQVLGNFPQQAVILILIELLQQTTDEELIAIAGKTLTEIGDEAIDALVDLLSQPERRHLAVKSLSYIRTAATIEPLIEVADDPDSEIRTMAVAALGSFHDRRVPPVLLEALQDRASSVRKAAAIALGFRADLCQQLDLVAHLQPLLKDVNLEICHQAAVSLGRMGTDPATSALFEVLQTETTPISLKFDAIEALGWSESCSGIDYLQRALKTTEEALIQKIIITLGKISTPELKHQAALALIDLWQEQPGHYSPSTKQALANSLGELRYRAAQTILQQLIEDGDRKVKLHAVCALNKLERF